VNAEVSTARILAREQADETNAYRFLPRFVGPLLERVMYLLILGVILMLMKYLEVGFVVDVSWWWVLSPFALAVVWWAWADSTGYTKRREMDKMDKKKQDRIDKQRENLGIKTKRRSR
jgi:small Trp-rich protein